MPETRLSHHSSFRNCLLLIVLVGLGCTNSSPDGKGIELSTESTSTTPSSLVGSKPILPEKSTAAQSLPKQDGIPHPSPNFEAENEIPRIDDKRTRVASEDVQDVTFQEGNPPTNAEWQDHAPVHSENEPPSLLVTSPSPASPDPSPEWSQFRGSDGEGHSSLKGLPLRWSKRKNITWSVPIQGLGWSSPVIKKDRIWLTTAIVRDKSLRVICLDAKNGQTLFNVEAVRKESLWSIHPKNSHATPTPVLFEHRCYVHFGSHGTACLSLAGQILWRTNVDYYHHHGPAGSPIIVDGLMIFACDGHMNSFYDDREIEGVTDPQFVIALDAMTGKVKWKSARTGAHSYSTPLVIEVRGQTQVVSPGGNGVFAYDPRTGDEIWRVQYNGYSVVPRPVYGKGLVFVCTGYDSPKLLAIRPDGKGDVTDSHVVWTATKSVPLNCSPILVGDELYIVSDSGVVSCLDAGTGNVIWRHRLGGNHSSSPVFADGRLYFLDEAGTTYILAAGSKPKILAKNLLPGRTQASLAMSGRAIFLRNETHLFRIEETDPKATLDNSDKSADEDHPSE